MREYMIEAIGIWGDLLLAPIGLMVGETGRPGLHSASPQWCAKRLRSVRATLPNTNGWVGKRWAATVVW